MANYKVIVPRLYTRKSIPSQFPDASSIVGIVNSGFSFSGEEVKNVPNPVLGKWIQDANGIYYWGGGLSEQVKNDPAPASTGIVSGIDVSHYNGILDWHTILTAGKTFCFIKASEGLTSHDPLAQQLSTGAHASGLKIGYYHFAVPDITAGDAAAQAAHFIDRVSNYGLAPFNLPLALDIETNKNNLNHIQLLDWITTFLKALEVKHPNTKPLIYSNTPFINDYLAANHNLGSYPLWLAQYRAEKSLVLPHGWTEYKIWQYSEKGTIPGLKGLFDLNNGVSSFISANV
jgi:lysozyme